MNYTEIRQDLFKMDEEYALAHCVSQCCAMGAGIAKEFRRRFPAMPHSVASSNPKIGDAISYETDQWIVFNLVTKEKYWHKPTRKTFETSIRSLKEELVKSGITKLAIPQLAAGLDRLDWNHSREVIQSIFEDTDVEIIVCLFK